MTPDEAIAASANLPSPDPVDAAVLDPALWTIESFALAQNDVFTPLSGVGAGPFDLTPAYEEHALAVARERAALAGARLGGLINASLK